MAEFAAMVTNPAKTPAETKVLVTEMERKMKRITDETASNEGGADDEGDGDSTPGKIPMSEAVGLFQKLLALKLCHIYLSNLMKVGMKCQ